MTRLIRATVLAMALLPLTAAGAGAAQIAVNTPADEFNSNVTTCSLREAIQAANTDSNAQSPGCTAGSGNDEIALKSGNYRTALPGSDDTNQGGDLDIGGSGSLAISAAPGADVVASSGVNNEGVFQVLAGGTASFSGITISGGDATFGGGIRNQGSVTVSAVALRANHSDAFGGAVDNSGTMSIADSLLALNDSDAFGGAIEQDGPGRLTVVRSTIRDNFSGAFGGGVVAGGPIDLDRVAITGNRSAAFAGGLLIETGNAATLVNSTVAGNSADAFAGGLMAENNGTVLRLVNSTVARNSQTNTAAGPRAGGIFQTTGATVQLQDSIVALNTDAAASNAAPDCNGTIASLGHSLLGSNQNCNYAAAAGDIVNADPKLAPLADNGGATLTMLPQAGSPAIDAGASALTVDQRGQPRPQDAFDVPNVANGTDIGAVELAGTTAPPPKCGGKSATIVGTAKNDKLKGTAKADVIFAGAGNDRVSAGKGNDIVCGGAGKDKLSGGSGKDVLKGGAGADKLVGGPGKDKLQGGAGKDSQKQ